MAARLRTSSATPFNLTRSRPGKPLTHKDVKNADRSEEVYENKGAHDKTPEKYSDFVSESAEFARNFGVFARNFAGFAHENRRRGGFISRHLARQTGRCNQCRMRRARTGTLGLVPDQHHPVAHGGGPSSTELEWGRAVVQPSRASGRCRCGGRRCRATALLGCAHRSVADIRPHVCASPARMLIKSRCIRRCV